jgi:hypothetical protein
MLVGILLKSLNVSTKDLRGCLDLKEVVEAGMTDMGCVLTPVSRLLFKGAILFIV